MSRAARLFLLLLLLAPLLRAQAQIPPAAGEALPANEGEDAPEAAVPAPAKAAVPAPAPEAPKTFNAVRLRGLDKVTARISTIDAPLGVVTRFENLEIIARKCWRAPPEERPENAALLEVRELKAGESPRDIFTGWMFSSSPALSSLEHAVYDITVIECENIKQPE